MDRVRRQVNNNRAAPVHSTRPKVDSRQQIVSLRGELEGKDEKTLYVALDGIANILASAGLHW